MDTLNLLMILAGLLVALVLLVLIYVLSSRAKKPLAIAAEVAPPSFEQLETIIHTKTSNNHSLNSAAKGILERFVTIEEFSRYGKLIEALCLHPNTDSKLISHFEKTLRISNPKHQEEIRKSLQEGLAKRDKK